MWRMFPANLGQIAILEIEKAAHKLRGFGALGQYSRGYPGSKPVNFVSSIVRN